MENNNRKYLKYIVIPLAIAVIAGAFFVGRNYVNNKPTTLNSQAAQDEATFAQDSKNEVESKPFIQKLPYHSDSFDIYYDSVNDTIQVILKTQNVTFDEAKRINETTVNNFLQSIGVPSDQKVVWLLSQ